MPNNRKIGDLGENMVCEFLQKNRFDVAAVELKSSGRMSMKYYVAAFDSSK